MSDSRAVYIASVARTPVGVLNGCLSTCSAVDLGVLAVNSALERASSDPTQLSRLRESIDEVIMGHVLSANTGQAPATQVVVKSGLSSSIPSTSVNKVCSSGMKAVTFGAQAIQTGNAHVIIAGGMESMSQTPYYLSKYRTGVKMGHQQLIDGIIIDGLWDPYHQFLMGDAAELCAKSYGISREEQDEYAISSYKRAIQAAQNGILSEYGVSINPKSSHGVDQHTESHHHPYFDENLQRFDESKLRKLKPVFKTSDGTVTAGNASGISDGACALVLVSGEKISEFDIQPLAKIISFADAQQDSEKFTTSPSLAIRKALDLACLSIEEIDVFEINEAFAVVALANQKLLRLPSDKLNILGGSVALGHPLGCSGARIIVSLISALRLRKGRYGCAAVCNGGGGASALIAELLR